jgi:hypothetical protein
METALNREAGASGIVNGRTANASMSPSSGPWEARSTAKPALGLGAVRADAPRRADAGRSALLGGPGVRWPRSTARLPMPASRARAALLDSLGQ